MTTYEESKSLCCKHVISQLFSKVPGGFSLINPPFACIVTRTASDNIKMFLIKTVLYQQKSSWILDKFYEAHLPKDVKEE